MIKVENIDVWGFEHAVRGMRNPHNSWANSDSKYRKGIDGMSIDASMANNYQIGKNDLDLMRKLYKAGAEHRKYARQIFVSMDITSNHTWWHDMDAYKIGITRDSCSKMHSIHIKEFTSEAFSTEGIDAVGGHTVEVFNIVVDELERLRNLFNETHEKKYWRAIMNLLPMGYNLRATVTMNYENVFNIIHQRTGHKLPEWNEFVDVLKYLPYVKEIMED